VQADGHEVECAVLLRCNSRKEQRRSHANPRGYRTPPRLFARDESLSEPPAATPWTIRRSAGSLRSRNEEESMRDRIDDERRRRQTAAARSAGSSPDGHLRRWNSATRIHTASWSRLKSAGAEESGWPNNLPQAA
jgi:hypothetical protein